MKVVIDIEANGLKNPTKIWLIVCKDIDTGGYSIFRNLVDDPSERLRFLSYAENVTGWIGHNVLGYDFIVLCDLLGFKYNVDLVFDTLILSRLIDYSRQGHSIDDYGKEFGLEKGKFTDFSKYTPEMEEYCIRDVDICHKVYVKYLKYINKPIHEPAIRMEHQFQLIANDMHRNGFSFNVKKAQKLLSDVEGSLSKLDLAIQAEFPPRLKAVREITPKLTKHGTLSRTDFRFLGPNPDLSDYNGGPFTRCKWVDFNASSPKQIIEVLNEAKWEPVDKTKTHIEIERELQQLRREKQRSSELDLRFHLLYSKLKMMERYGWKVNETNLHTLPSSAPSPARTLAKRILLEARRRTLTEWLGLVDPESNRIHGEFYGIGAWTHRMAHQKPNTANIPNEFDTSGNIKLYGKEMRSLWRAPKNRLLVGVDAEGIQLRIFAHYIDDKEFTEALVNGKKEDKSDPHSLNQRILGSVCKTRDAAKRFIFALLLGAGLGKLAEILGCSLEEAEAALNRLLARYEGFEYLKKSVIPADARRGWFTGLDGRSVAILGDTVGMRRHLCMSGYLQNGESVVMKHATVRWTSQLRELNVPDWMLVDMVHDEWQTECMNNVEVALKIAKVQADSLVWTGNKLNLKCPLAGSYWNDKLKDYTIGTNWYQTH